MARIQSSVGLITGTNITSTVDQLMKISAQPRDRIQAKVKDIQSEQVAVGELTALVIGVQIAAKRLATDSLYNTNKVASSNPTALLVSKNGEPQIGDASVQVLSVAQTHTSASKTFSSASQALGVSGTLQIRSQGFVDESRQLSELNGGSGVQSGSIRLTDRSGESETIDLRSARNVDDVLRTINAAANVQIRATAEGDRIVLQDFSGGTGLLRVDEVGSGLTAADLGFNQVAVAADSVTGGDILRLSDETKLNSLRDALGIELNPSGNDLRVTFRNGSTLDVDFGDFSRPAAKSSATTNASNLNAQLKIEAKATGGNADGIEIVYIDDPSIAAGSESVELLETSNSRKLVFRIDAGNTTAAGVRNALNSNSTLSQTFTATALGTGLGTVSTQDTATLSGGAAISAPDTPTIKDLLRVLNQADPARLSAKISASGDRLELTDLTTGSGNLIVANSTGSSAASQLGLAGSFAANTITGGSLGSGLRSVRLENLATVGSTPLGSLNVTTRDGNTGSINLSSAKTLQDVINAIGNSGLGISAQFNESGTGLSVRDLTGGSSSEFIVSSTDETANRLGLAASSLDSVISGKSLDRKFISRNTSLQTLNQGKGISEGSFTIIDSKGQTSAINLRILKPKTVGDVVDAINKLTVSVEARINAKGDGIELIDTGNGTGTLRVNNTIGQTAASDLRIAGTAQRQVVAGKVVQAIDGSQVDRILVQTSDTLATIAEKIQNQSKLASASTVQGPSGSRLQLLSQRGGNAGRLAIDDGGLGLQFRNSQTGQDATIAVGTGNQTSYFYSSDGVFNDAIAGVSITATQVSEAPIKVSVTKDNEAVVTAVNSIVEQYNRLVDKIDSVSFFKVEDNTTGILFGRGEILQIQSSFSRLFTDRFFVSGSINSLQTLGVGLTDKGKLELSTTKLKAQLERDPESVRILLSDETSGVQKKLDALTERFAGVNNGLLLTRTQALNDQLASAGERIDAMNSRLEKERERLLKQFYSMELAISKIQSNQSAVDKISRISFPNE